MEAHVSETTPILEDKTESDKQQTTVKRCITVEPAAVLGIMYMAGIMPWTQQYVYHRLATAENLMFVENNTLCREGLEYSDSNYLAEQDAQTRTSFKLASYNAASLVPLLCSSVILGSLSDFIGRKFILLIPVVGALVRVGITSFVVMFELSLNYLYLAVISESLLGGPMVFLGIIYAYISDVTTISERAFRIIAIELSVVLGVVLSMIGFGYLIMYQGFLIPVVVLMGFCVVNILYISFFLQESRPRRPPYQNKFWTLDIVKQVFFLYKRDTDRGRRWRLFVALLMFLLAAVGELGKLDVTVLYVLASPFCFTPVTIAVFATVTLVLSGIGAVTITKLLKRWLNEIALYIIGSISSLTSCLLLGFAKSVAVIFGASLANVFGRLQMGMIRSYMSKLVDENEQGILFTSLAWFDQAAVVMGSVVFNIIYAGTISVHAGFVFFLIAGLFLVAILIAVIVIAVESKSSRLVQPTT